MQSVENALLQQMQKLAASMNAMQSAANKDKGGQVSVSFQEMLQKPGEKFQKISRLVSVSWSASREILVPQSNTPAVLP